MASPTHPLGAPNIMEKYFNTLPANDISRRYYAGEKYESTFFNRIGLFFSVNSTLKELTNFYPYSPVVVQS